MYALIFTRFTNGSDFVALSGAYQTEAEAVEAMRREYDRCLDELGFDPEFSRIDERSGQAFCGSYDMLADSVRLHVFDTEHPCGHDNSRMLDFHLCLSESDDEL